jgi:hypothetical protein
MGVSPTTYSTYYVNIGALAFQSVFFITAALYVEHLRFKLNDGQVLYVQELDPENQNPSFFIAEGENTVN